jgi:hypothetical protein
VIVVLILQVVLDGFTCVLFGNSADYMAYPLFFSITRFAVAWKAIYSIKEAASNHPNNPNHPNHLFTLITNPNHPSNSNRPKHPNK